MRAWGVLAAVAAVLVVFPSGATAKPGYFVSGPGRSAKFRVRGSNGYRIEVQAGAASIAEGVEVIAKSGSASVSYLAEGSLGSDDSIDAHLPHVGRIAVDFETRHVIHRRPPEDCKGRASIVEHGYFRGRIELHGQRGFTTVDRTSAPGKVVQHFRQVCHFGEPGHRHAKHPKHSKDEFALSFLFASREDGGANFTALAGESGSIFAEPIFGATEFKATEGMAMISSVYAEGTPLDLILPEADSLKTAEVKPPPPFEGTASFEVTGPKKSTWRGDLAVELPAIGRVTLAGPKFFSELCRGQHCTHTSPSNDGTFVAGIFGTATRSAVPYPHIRGQRNSGATRR